MCRTFTFTFTFRNPYLRSPPFPTQTDSQGHLHHQFGHLRGARRQTALPRRSTRRIFCDFLSPPNPSSIQTFYVSTPVGKHRTIARNQNVTQLNQLTRELLETDLSNLTYQTSLTPMPRIRLTSQHQSDRLHHTIFELQIPASLHISNPHTPLNQPTSSTQ